MITKHPRQRLDDSTADLGELEDWLRAQSAEGWHPEYDGDGVDVVVNGQMVRRFAMIKHSPPQDG